MEESLKLRLRWSHVFAAASGTVSGIFWQLFLNHGRGTYSPFLAFLSIVLSFGFCWYFAVDTHNDTPVRRFWRILILFLISSVFTLGAYFFL